jgi:hypothetical protein
MQLHKYTYITVFSHILTSVRPTVWSFVRPSVYSYICVSEANRAISQNNLILIVNYGLDFNQLFSRPSQSSTAQRTKHFGCSSSTYCTCTVYAARPRHFVHICVYTDKLLRNSDAAFQNSFEGRMLLFPVQVDKYRTIGSTKNHIDEKPSVDTKLYSDVSC